MVDFARKLPEQANRKGGLLVLEALHISCSLFIGTEDPKQAQETQPIVNTSYKEPHSTSKKREMDPLQATLSTSLQKAHIVREECSKVQWR